MPSKPDKHEPRSALRRRAERVTMKGGQETNMPRTEVDAQRLLHELEVHQIELEMQNAELRLARDEAEQVLEKYTDLYDFAPVGYFTLAADGTIRLVNLTGATLVGTERSRLIGRSFVLLVSPELRPVFTTFLRQVFENHAKQSIDSCLLQKKDQPLRHVSMEAQSSHGDRECRIAIMDITERKRAEAAQRDLDVLTASNLKLQQEIVRRQALEEALHKTREEETRLLIQSRQQEIQMRDLSHQIIHSQEDERKRISRELHDVIAQTLVGINVSVAALGQGAPGDSAGFQQKITRTRRLVEKSVEIVHRFARELRPTMLDDLGLIPALRTLMKGFMEETGVRVSLKTFAGIEKSNDPIRTSLYRIAQEALANVARHAKASKAEVSISNIGGPIRMEITDDGKGFEVDGPHVRRKHKRLGLLGMRERVEMIGGTFCVESSPGHGTTVRVEIPVQKSGGRKPAKKKSPATKSLECT